MQICKTILLSIELRFFSPHNESNESLNGVRPHDLRSTIFGVCTLCSIGDVELCKRYQRPTNSVLPDKLSTVYLVAFFLRERE